MDEFAENQRLRIEQALSARLELLSGGASGAATYNVHGLEEPCVLKIIAAESAVEVRARGYREIHFYNQLAAHVPLRTPHVLASLIEESGFCGLLLKVYQPLKPANDLNGAAFTEIAKELAGFHAAYWNQTDQFEHLSWLEKPKIFDFTNDIRRASETWQALARQPQLQEILTDSTLREIQAALTALRAEPEHDSAVMLTLCHGDCHVGNLLRDREGDLIWTDWQEVRIGFGSDDLTFLIQRAEANGANINHDIVIAAYCKTLEAAGVQGVSEEATKSAMRESERRTRLLHWPEYMSDAAPDAMAHHLTRIFFA